MIGAIAAPATASMTMIATRPGTSRGTTTATTTRALAASCTFSGRNRPPTEPYKAPETKLAALETARISPAIDSSPFWPANEVTRMGLAPKKNPRPRLTPKAQMNRRLHSPCGRPSTRSLDVTAGGWVRRCRDRIPQPARTSRQAAAEGTHDEMDAPRSVAIGAAAKKTTLLTSASNENAALRSRLSDTTCDHREADSAPGCGSTAPAAAASRKTAAVDPRSSVPMSATIKVACNPASTGTV